MVGEFGEDECGKAARDRVGPDLDEDGGRSSSLEESRSTRSKDSVRSIAWASCPSLTTVARRPFRSRGRKRAIPARHCPLPPISSPAASLHRDPVCRLPSGDSKLRPGPAAPGWSPLWVDEPPRGVVATHAARYSRAHCWARRHARRGGAKAAPMWRGVKAMTGPRQYWWCFIAAIERHR